METQTASGIVLPRRSLVPLLFGAGAAAAVLVPDEAEASTTTACDFYYSKGKYYAGGSSANGGYFQFTNYDHGCSGQDYHIAAFSGGSLTRRATYFDGVLLPYKGENYVYRNDRRTHTIKQEWSYSNGQLASSMTRSVTF